ncbi:hypothetical protein AK85_10690, partial [Streptococcus pneumoniae B1598]
KTWATIRTRIDNGGKRAVLTITGQSPKDLYGIYNTILTVTEGNGHVSSKTQRGSVSTTKTRIWMNLHYIQERLLNKM